MAAFDLLGRRWTLRILWELRDGPLGARRLLGRCDGLSSSVLYDRLRELQAAGLIVQDGSGAYELTDLGASLRSALKPLDAWASRWAAELAKLDMDADAASKLRVRGEALKGDPSGDRRPHTGVSLRDRREPR